MRNAEVDEWFAGHDNPQKEVLLYMRKAILESVCELDVPHRDR